MLEQKSHRKFSSRLVPLNNGKFLCASASCIENIKKPLMLMGAIDALLKSVKNRLWSTVLWHWRSVLLWPIGRQLKHFNGKLHGKLTLSKSHKKILQRKKKRFEMGLTLSQVAYLLRADKKLDFCATEFSFEPPKPNLVLLVVLSINVQNWFWYFSSIPKSWWFWSTDLSVKKDFLPNHRP